MGKEIDNIKTEQSKDVLEKNSWGYVVCFGTVIVFIAGIGHVNSFGLIYNDFIIETHSTAKSLTTAHGVFSIMLAFGGILLNIMRKKFTLRLVGIIGTVLFTMGSLTTILISNTNQLPFTFGVLQGIGFGIMVPVCYSTLNHYFVRKRTTVMSICKAAQGVILMWYPLLLRKMMSIYGFRGTLLIIAGISLNMYPGMLAMKINKVTRRIRTANSIENGNDGHEAVDLLNEENNNNNYIPKTLIKKIRSSVLEILNLKALRDPVYCNTCIGQSFVNFSDLTFFILQPMLLFQYGYTKIQVATCISICTGADVAGRCVLAAISGVTPINTRILYYVATLFTFVIRIATLQMRQFAWVASVTGLLGVMRAWLHISSPLVISNHVTNEDFPGAYALFMLSAGLVNVVCSPLIGLLKDIYQDFIPAFYALTACCLPCLLFWPVEYLFQKRATS